MNMILSDSYLVCLLNMAFNARVTSRVKHADRVTNDLVRFGQRTHISSTSDMCARTQQSVKRLRLLSGLRVIRRPLGQICIALPLIRAHIRD